MLSDFCRKHRMASALCGCLAASIAAPYLASVWNGDPQAKLPRINMMGQGLTMGATGTATTSSPGVTIVSDATITVCLGLAGSAAKSSRWPDWCGRR